MTTQTNQMRGAAMESSEQMSEDATDDVYCPFSDTGDCSGGCPDNRNRACIATEMTKVDCVEVVADDAAVAEWVALEAERDHAQMSSPG